MLMISQSLKERLDGKPFPLPAGVTLFKILVTSSALIFRPCNVKACSLFLICFCNIGGSEKLRDRHQKHPAACEKNTSGTQGNMHAFMSLEK